MLYYNKSSPAGLGNLRNAYPAPPPAPPSRPRPPAGLRLAVHSAHVGRATAGDERCVDRRLVGGGGLGDGLNDRKAPDVLRAAISQPHPRLRSPPGGAHLDGKIEGGAL